MRGFASLGILIGIGVIIAGILGVLAWQTTCCSELDFETVFVPAGSHVHEDGSVHHDDHGEVTDIEGAGL